MSGEEQIPIPFVVKHEKTIGPIVGFALFGGFLTIIIIVPAGEGETFLFLGFSWLILFGLFFYLGVKQNTEYEEKKKLATEKSRKRNQENQRKKREVERKKVQEHREKELNLANRLVEEGGIENLNKAIGIFKKHEK